MPRRRVNLIHRLPEPQSAVADRKFRRNGEAAHLEVNKQLTPALRAFPGADMEAEELLFAFGRSADDNEDAFGLPPLLSNPNTGTLPAAPRPRFPFREPPK